MSIKIFSILTVLLLFISCKKTQETTPEETEKQQSKNVTEKDISKLKYTEYALDSKTEVIIKDWQEYYQLKDIIDNVKKGDLSFFYDNEDTIQILIKKIKETIPTDIISDGILARLLVLETKLLKLKSLSNLSTTSKQELLNTIEEFLVAFSNVNFQMNKKVEFDNQNIETL